MISQNKFSTIYHHYSCNKHSYRTQMVLFVVNCQGLKGYARKCSQCLDRNTYFHWTQLQHRHPPGRSLCWYAQLLRCNVIRITYNEHKLRNVCHWAAWSGRVSFLPGPLKFKTRDCCVICKKAICTEKFVGTFLSKNCLRWVRKVRKDHAIH